MTIKQGNPAVSLRLSAAGATVAALLLPAQAAASSHPGAGEPPVTSGFLGLSGVGILETGHRAPAILDLAILLVIAVSVISFGYLLRLRYRSPREVVAGPGPGSHPHQHETALRAQQQFRTLSFTFAPAVAAGALAAVRLDNPGNALIVAVAVGAVSLLLRRRRIPLHLMPLSSVTVAVAVPVLGLVLALATLSVGSQPVSVSSLFVPLIGAWLITGLTMWLSRRFEASRKVRVAIIGSPGLAIGLARELQVANIHSHEVVGWLADERPAAELGSEPGWLGSLASLRSVVEANSIELLVHSNGAWDPDEQPHQSRLELFDEVATACLDLPVRLVEATQLYEELLGHVPLGQANSAWFQYLLHPRFRAGSARLKRIFDISVAAGMLIVLAPTLACFAILVKLTDGGPVFYRQRRVGEKGREFEMIKLRSMRVDSENVGPQWSMADDDRVTSVGRIMRRLHVDEMPQLWNILRGDMTIVGPRPERRELIVRLEAQLSYYDRRHLVKPGLAGWAQACCGYSGTAEGTSWKLCHDLYYLKHRSIYFDLLILLENFRVSLRGGVQFGLAVPQEQFIIGS